MKGAKNPDIVLWTVAIFTVFWSLGSRSLWGAECRWAEISRMMVLSGDFFKPVINGEIYFDKPLLTYWLIALPGLLFGVSEWTIRIPSAIAGLAGIWGTFYLGTKLWDRECGRLAAWILLGTYGFLLWSRTAAADMQNMTATLLAVCWYFHAERKSTKALSADENAGKKGGWNFASYLILYSICAIGSHMKGLTALVIPVILLFPHYIREMRWKKHIHLKNFAAIVLATILYLLPFIYSSMTNENIGDVGFKAAMEAKKESGIYMVFRENVERFFAPFDHKDPFYCYFYHLPRLFLPWSLLLVATFAFAFTSCRKKLRASLSSEDKWLLAAIALVFLFFSASGSRRVYYILPLLPFSAILTARYLQSSSHPKIKNALIQTMKGAIWLAIGLSLSSPAIFHAAERIFQFDAPFAMRISTPIIGLVGLGILLLDRKREGILSQSSGLPQGYAAMILSMTCFMSSFFCFQYESLESLRTERPFALELKKHVQGLSESDIVFYPKVSNFSYYYLDLPFAVKSIQKKEDLCKFLHERKGKRIFISQPRYFQDFEGLIPMPRLQNPDIREVEFVWENEKHKKMQAWIFP